MAKRRTIEIKDQSAFEVKRVIKARRRRGQSDPFPLPLPIEPVKHKIPWKWLRFFPKFVSLLVLFSFFAFSLTLLSSSSSAVKAPAPQVLSQRAKLPPLPYEQTSLFDLNLWPYRNNGTPAGTIGDPLSLLDSINRCQSAKVAIVDYISLSDATRARYQNDLTTYISQVTGGICSLEEVTFFTPSPALMSAFYNSPTSLYYDYTCERYSAYLALDYIEELADYDFIIGFSNRTNAKATALSCDTDERMVDKTKMYKQTYVQILTRLGHEMVHGLHIGHIIRVTFRTSPVLTNGILDYNPALQSAYYYEDGDSYSYNRSPMYYQWESTYQLLLDDIHLYHLLDPQKLLLSYIHQPAYNQLRSTIPVDLSAFENEVLKPVVTVANPLESPVQFSLSSAIEEHRILVVEDHIDFHGYQIREIVLDPIITKANVQAVEVQLYTYDNKIITLGLLDLGHSYDFKIMDTVFTLERINSDTFVISAVQNP
ncbi:MAG: hypothetical protein LBR25_08225 [Erysipelotrichaceae bacterium]|jgi:hypothetical protein|nr:hypothetical protein [Erysipelotrichaceae bacterium]